MPRAPRQKEASRRRIVAAASRRLRGHGLAGASVAETMGEAGLTHGGFYAHFEDKDALIAAGLDAAMAESRAAWTASLDGLAPEDALRQILGRYLSRPHRMSPESGCPMAATGSELGRAPEDARRAFEPALEATIAVLAAHLPARGALDARARALATIALCLGGMTLARLAASPALADEILRAARRLGLAAGLSEDEPGR